MAKISFDGLSKYTEEIGWLKEKTVTICKAAVYDGAGVVADAIQQETRHVEPWRGFTDEMEKGLEAGLGIAKIEAKDGSVNTKIGYAGYNPKKTKKYPKGIPNALLARSIIRGASHGGNKFRWKNDYVKRAVKRSQDKAVQSMGQRIEEEIQKIVK